MKGGDSMKSLATFARSGALTLATTLMSMYPAIAAGTATTITVADPQMGVKDFSTFVSAAVKIAIMLAALLTFAFLIWGGIEWITSGGDKSKYEAARNRITAALVGLAIVAAAWAIMTLVSKFLNVDPFKLEIPSAGGK